MRCGLYGKLPSKRDFISIATPRQFLPVWEPWIANCLAESRVALGGAAWDKAFEEAPIWRFFLGADLFGAGLCGVLMPSVDAIGRYFPLTLVARTELDPDLPMAEIDPCETWFAAVETFLLSLLDAALPWGAIDTGLKTLGALNLQSPPQNADAAAKLEFASLDDADAGVRTLEDIFITGRQQDDVPVTAANYWWTLGNENYRPRAFVQGFMPDPQHFTAMLTEGFATRPRETSQSG
jgi:type VI secretion system protein ImpM